MPYTVEGYWEQENNQAVTDRIEIQEDGGSGRNLELGASDEGFRWRLSEITGDSSDGMINPLANKIQTGKLSFFPRIQSSAEKTLMDDIADATETTFRIVWKRDGTVFWTGNIDNKIRSFPESGGAYYAKLRANDFEILASIDYTLDDTRQTLITTIADLLGNLNFGYKIRTATSWITEDTTDSTDFLSQIYHETKALREFARTGDESDQPISVWQALEKIGAPALLFRQVNGEFTVEQLTEFDDPQNVNETLYTSAGAVDTATSTVDRRQSGFKSTSGGSLVVKSTSQNERYPGIKRARAKFDHRTEVSGITFPEEIDPNTSFSQTIISDGGQKILLGVTCVGRLTSGTTTSQAGVKIQAGGYWWDEDNKAWQSTAAQFIDIDLTILGEFSGVVFGVGVLSVDTNNLPADADGTLTVSFDTVDNDNGDSYYKASITIQNDVAENNSDHILYELTQSDGYATEFTLADSWFGDGPTGYSLAALRYSSSDGDTTIDSWQRRGTTTGYRNFHKQLLKEVIDLQRTPLRKLTADFWGNYDPSKILVYDSENFYCAGVSYTGTKGRWSAILYRINIQTGSDTFEDIPKFFGEGITGKSTTSTSGSTGGGLDQSTADTRYLNEASNLSDLDSVDTALGNLSLVTELKDLTSAEVNQVANINSKTISNTQWGYLGAMDQGVATTDDVVFNKVTTDDIILSGSRPKIQHTVSGSEQYSVYFNRDITGFTGNDSPFNNGLTIESDQLIAFIESDNDKVIGWMDVNSEKFSWSGTLDATIVQVDGDWQFRTQTPGSVNRLFVDPINSNSNVEVFLAPSGTATSSKLTLADGSNQTNYEGIEFVADATTNRITSLTEGTGTIRELQLRVDGAEDLSLWTNSSKRVDILSGGTVNVNGTALYTFGNEQTVSTEADVNFASVTLPDSGGYITSTTFASGFAGAGMEIRQGSGTWDGTLDNLSVRERLRVYELLINQIRASNGSVWVANADRVDSVTQQEEEVQWSSSTAWNSSTFWRPTYRCFVGDDQFVNFSEDDLVRAQRFTGRGTYVVKGTVVAVENGDPDVTVNTTARYFDLALEPGSDTPTAEMEFVRIGNRTDTSRQGAIYLSSDDDDAPFIDIIDGVSTHAEFGTTDKNKARFGLLDGLTTTTFSDLDGNQTDLWGIYMKGNVYVDDGNFRGVVTITDTDASNAATKTYVDDATTGGLGNEILRQDSEPTTRSDGSSLQTGDIWEDTDATTGNSFQMWNGSAFVDAFTVIDGGSLATGSVTAAKINVSDLYATDATITATLTLGSGAEFVNSGNTVLLDGSTFVLGSSAAAQTLTSGVGIFGNTSGHFRAGDASADHFKWNGTTLSINGELDLPGLINPGSNTWIGNNIQSKNSGTSKLLLGDFDGSGTDPRLILRGSSANTRFRIRDTEVSGEDSGGNQVFKIDLSGGDEHTLGGAFFSDTEIWLGTASTKKSRLNSNNDFMSAPSKDADVVNKGTGSSIPHTTTDNSTTAYEPHKLVFTLSESGTGVGVIDVTVSGATSSGGTYNTLKTHSSLVGNGATETFTIHFFTEQYSWIKIEWTANASNAGDVTLDSYDCDRFEGRSEISRRGFINYSSDVQFVKVGAGIFESSGEVFMKNLPTYDPEVAGAIYRSGNDLRVSTG